MTEFNDGNLSFLLSMPRSGSTLLSLMLGSHPEICCPPEPWIVLAVAEYLKLGNVSEIPYGREWGEIAAIEFLLNPERKNRGSLNSIIQNSGNSIGSSAIDKAKSFLSGAYQLYLNSAGKTLFVDKTPRYYAALSLIDEIFPKSKKIVLLRNPLDIFASHKSTWNISKDIFTSEGANAHTRDFCEGLFTFEKVATTRSENILVIRYEELTGNPEKVLRSACAFSGLEFSTDMLTYYENNALTDLYSKSIVGDPIASNQPKSANTFSVNGWENRLEIEDIQALIDVLGLDIFERLGYGETVVRLRNMNLHIATEDQAKTSRRLLMDSLVENVCEEPFSLWNNFVSPLNELRMNLENSESDSAKRLEMIHQLQVTAAELRKNLEISESDRAKRLEVIRQLQSAEAELKKNLEISESDYAKRFEMIHQLQVAAVESRKKLEISELDSAKKLEVIHQQQATENELKRRLDNCESERMATLEIIRHQQSSENDLRQKLEILASERIATLVVIHEHQISKQKLEHRLEISEVDRAASVEVIQKQQALEKELKRRLEILEIDQSENQQFIQQLENEKKQLDEKIDIANKLHNQQNAIIERQIIELENIKKWKVFFKFKLAQFKNKLSKKSSH